MNNKIGKDHPSSWNPNADKLTIHGWIRYHYKKKYICTVCGKIGKTHWSSNTHEYTRDINEYQERCCSCHMKYDFKMGFRSRNITQ